MTVATRIKELRKERGWTQKELAHKIEVSPQVVSNWERAYTTPDTEDLTRLAHAFDVQADYLLLGRSAAAAAAPEQLLAPEEMQILQEMRRHTKFKAFFHDLSSAPEEKIRQLIKMWEIIKGDIENDDDEEPDE